MTPAETPSGRSWRWRGASQEPTISNTLNQPGITSDQLVTANAEGFCQWRMPTDHKSQRQTEEQQAASAFLTNHVRQATMTHANDLLYLIHDKPA